MKKSSNNLVGKTVMSEKGIPIGVIKKSLTDSTSGKIKSFLINPSQKINTENYKKNKQGEIVLPGECVSTVQDIVVFEKKPFC